MRVFYLLLPVILLFNISYSKGFKGGFKSYKLYQTKIKKKSAMEHSYYKIKRNKTSSSSLLQSKWFRWFIGGMIFGAFLSFLMGNGLHIGMPGLLELMLIGTVIYFLVSKIKNRERAKDGV